jgi:xylan 1,4-beta-xylosidase
VSFHAKGGVTVTDGHVQMDLGNQLRLHRAGFDAVAASKKFAHTPIVITEADPDGCAACPVSRAPQYAYRNSPAYGAYEVAMMKRTLDLSMEAGVNLRGVLTWAFTFPGSPYFAGYRALSSHGIHLPVLNALGLLGSLRGARLPVASSGALPLGDLLDGSVRVQPDIDALAAIDGERIRILVWHYHDDLVDAPSVPVTLQVSVPPAFAPSPAAPAVHVTHTRVDGTHGDAYAVWVSQGSPAAPSAPERAALQAAMLPVVLDAERLVPVANGAVSLSFDLPRFGVSLIDVVPAMASEPVQAPGSGASCSCRFAAPSRAPLPALLAFLLVGPACRRRFARDGRRGVEPRLTWPGKHPIGCRWRAPS